MSHHPLVAVASASLPLSGTWRFAVDPNASGESAGWTDPGFDDSGWTGVTLPHTWNVMNDYVNYQDRAWADATKFTDFVMMNQYFGTWHGPKDGLGLALDTVHLAWPDKTVIISEFGFCPHWQSVEGPARIDPSQYYTTADDAPPDSEEVDVTRCSLIAEQMALFRTKPFVAGAIFWTYQNRMGVVDEERNRRGSWWALREEYAPVLIDSVTFSSAAGGHCSARVMLRTRGPLEEDMPVYTLRGYRLGWAVLSLEDLSTITEGHIPLPTLAPEAGWSGEVTWARPEVDYILTISILRPTGFSVIERSYNSLGKRVPAR